MKRLLYFVGEPGVGKSTLVSAITMTWDRYDVAKPFAHIVYENGAIQLGAAHPTFPGTDRLSMSVIGKAIEFVQASEAPLILGEGDRLANIRFLEAASENYYVTLVVCTIDEKTLAERRAKRGTEQNATWLQGRRTKVLNLAKAWHGDRIEVRTDAQGVAALEEYLP